jgi:hypothetical protein
MKCRSRLQTHAALIETAAGRGRARLAYCGASLEVPDLMPPPPDHVPVPAVPLWLGASGLIPFILLAGALWISPVDYHPVLHDWIRTYAAVILSFIGAIHWGVAMVHRDMTDHDRAVLMGWSVVPSLVAWLGLLMPLRTGLALAAAMFIVHYTMDRQLVTRFDLPGWYLRLRGGLTAVVVVCLGIAAIR